MDRRTSRTAYHLAVFENGKQILSSVGCFDNEVSLKDWIIQSLQPYPIYDAYTKATKLVDRGKTSVLVCNKDELDVKWYKLELKQIIEEEVE